MTTELSYHNHTLVENNTTFTTPHHSFFLFRKLYVSTLDGVLTALDSNGRRLWRYRSDQPLYSSTLTYSEVCTHIYE